MVKVSSIGEVSRLRTFGLVVACILMLSGCDFQSESRPSLLVIAVEGLGFDSFNCESDQLQERDMAGFKVFCDEAVRFTHAFAPSTMSQATMASLLTGQYPIDHGIHHNGSQFLSATVETLPEVVVDKGYRTLFVSGGPPLWRKSGFVQGFETFDDNVEVGPGRYYRPVGDVFQTFSSWLNKEVETSAFLSFLFLADLQFPQFATQASDGEPREKSLSGQVAQIGDSLNLLVQKLKAARRWNNTMVILVGLNGMRSSVTDTELSTLNLKSKSVQVALYIKPVRKERDPVQQWTIDKNVSLVDVGWTLFTMMGGDPKPPKWSQIQPVSMAMALNTPGAGWSEHRLILSESAWPGWVDAGGTRWAIRQNQFLYIHDRRPEIYNTLTDRLESMKVGATDPLWNSLNQDVISFVNEASLEPWNNLESLWVDQVGLARTLWGPTTETTDRAAIIKNLGKGPDRGPWQQWGARLALQEDRWADLDELGQKAHEELWSYVGKSNLGARALVPKEPCFKIFVTGLKGNIGDCKDDTAVALWDWMKADTDEARASTKDKFLKMYLNSWVAGQIGVLNYLNDIRWDVSPGIPSGPSLVELVLALKEFEPFRQKLRSSVNNVDVRF
jgi:hypothetical protein